MILLHTSDWHLGLQFQARSIYEDQKYFIDDICRIIEEEKVDAVLLGGDVFDRSIASAEALRLYDYAMTKICCELKVPVMIAAGNHDGADRLSSCNAILSAGGLYVAGHLGRKCMKVEFEDTEIFILPWLTTEKAAFIFPERAEEIKSVEDAYKCVCEAIREDFTEGKRHILVGHAYVVGAATSVSDKSAVIGTAAAIGSSVFDGFDYVALGHIHGDQDIREHIRYSGTPMIYSFGSEEHQQKSVTLIDTEDMSRRLVPIRNLRAHTTITGTYEELLAANYEQSIKEGYVKLDITDTYAGGEVYSIMRERYPLLLEVRGTDLDKEGTGSSMSLEEFEKEEQDPASIFERYIGENTGVSYNNHILKLFSTALEKYNGEVSE